MEIIKSSWAADDNRITFQVPFSKVDAENRTVSGFATLDNVDRVGDICTADASNTAFENFRGNIREMHQPIAAGRLLSFVQKDFYDFNSDTTYRGIYVTVYVSKGAQATWEKVLDGTLSGFSIGGNITGQENVFDAENNRTIRVIKEYDLVELSLVDSPANSLANVFSIVKSDTGELTYKGLATETVTSNVYYCPSDQIAVVSSDSSQSCASCNKNMENIGWIESTDTDNTDILRDVVSKYLNPEPGNSQVEVNINEGGIEVSESIATSVEEVEPIEKADEVVEEAVVTSEDVAEVAADEAVADEVEKADEGSEVEAVDSSVDFVKLFEDLRATIVKGTEDSNAKVEGIRTSVDEFVKTVQAQFTDLGTSHAELAKSVETLSESLAAVEARVEEVNSSTAVKKSSELGGSEEVKTTKSIWGGRFLGVDSL
jgi:hypothetical protein